MASPYQSRLFQTLRSLSRTAQDTLDLRWRQLRVAVNWGVQAGLYPLLVLFQTGRWGKQVFQQTVTAVRSRLGAAVGHAPDPVDQPIRALLDALDLIPLPSSTTSKEITAQSPALHLSLRAIPHPPRPWYKTLGAIVQAGVRWLQGQPPRRQLRSSGELGTAAPGTLNPIRLQGVASLLVHQRLVLVTTDNQLLDILTPTQQQQLHQRIIWEIAQAHYRRRQWHPVRPWLGWKAAQALPIPAARPQQLPPVRALYHILGWVQQATVESGAKRLPFVQHRLPSPPRLALPQRWAGFFSACLPAKGRSPLPLPAAPSAPLTPWGQKLHACRLLLASVVGAIALLPFTLGLAQPAQAAATPALPPLPNPITVEWIIDPGRTRRRWREDPEQSDATSSPSQGKVRIEAQKVQGSLGQWASQFAKTHPSARHSTLEVEAVFMGYDRHPLETLLLWLDAAMAWVEAQVLRLVEHCKPILTGLFNL